MSLRYRILVNNHLEAYWGRWFDQITIRNLENGLTELEGTFKDQDALHRILDKIRDLNLALVSLESEGEQHLHRETDFDLNEGWVYEIKVRASGEPWWAGWFEEVDLQLLEKDEYLMNLLLNDEPALHGLLARLRAAHLTLLSVYRVPAHKSTICDGQ